MAFTPQVMGIDTTTRMRLRSSVLHFRDADDV
jgi:hypothetical protein